MGDPSIKTLSETDALDRIVDTVKRAGRGEAPFALVLGSGFSSGLVPTARELVREDLALWVKSQKEGRPFDSFKEAPSSERRDHRP